MEKVTLAWGEKAVVMLDKRFTYLNSPGLWPTACQITYAGLLSSPPLPTLPPAAPGPRSGRRRAPVEPALSRIAERRDPKTPPRRPKTPPRWPKTPPRWPRDAPRRPQDASRRVQDASKTPQDGPKTAQDTSEVRF